MNHLGGVPGICVGQIWRRKEWLRDEADYVIDEVGCYDVTVRSREVGCPVWGPSVSVALVVLAVMLKTARLVEVVQS